MSNEYQQPESESDGDKAEEQITLPEKPGCCSGARLPKEQRVAILKKKLKE